MYFANQGGGGGGQRSSGVGGGAGQHHQGGQQFNFMGQGSDFFQGFQSKYYSSPIRISI